MNDRTSNHQRVWIAMKGNEESLRLAEADGWEVHEVAKAPTTNSPEDIRQSMDLLQQIHRDSLPDTAEITSLRAQLSAAHRAQRTAEAETAKAMAAHALDIRDRSLPVETSSVITPLEQLLVEWWSTDMENADLFNRAVRLSPALAAAMNALPEKSE